MREETMTTPSKRELAGAAALVLAMAATRYHHFGSAIGLPDASLAAFFLAGAGLHSARWFALLLAEAALVDALAITVGGVSAWCVTPAYPVLALAYGAAWCAGRWHAIQPQPSLLRLALAAVGGVSTAFVVSNASFYALSGYFTELGLSEYAHRVARYYPPYLLNTLGYVALAVLLRAALAATLRRRFPRATVGRMGRGE